MMFRWWLKMLKAKEGFAVETGAEFDLVQRSHHRYGQEDDVVDVSVITHALKTSLKALPIGAMAFGRPSHDHS